jgi:hypothetical protein
MTNARAKRANHEELCNLRDVSDAQVALHQDLVIRKKTSKALKVKAKVFATEGREHLHAY